MQIVITLNNKVLLVATPTTWSEIYRQLQIEQKHYVETAAAGNNDLANFAFANWHKLCAEVSCALIAPQKPTETNKIPDAPDGEHWDNTPGSALRLCHFKLPNVLRPEIELELTVVAYGMETEDYPGLPEFSTAVEPGNKPQPVFTSEYHAQLKIESEVNGARYTSTTAIDADSLESVLNHPMFAELAHLIPDASFIGEFLIRGDKVKGFIRSSGALKVVPEFSKKYYDLTLYSPVNLEPVASVTAQELDMVFNDIFDCSDFNHHHKWMLVTELYSHDFARSIRAGGGWRSALIEITPHEEEIAHAVSEPNC